jgi:hypothetical protein
MKTVTNEHFVVIIDKTDIYVDSMRGLLIENAKGEEQKKKLLEVTDRLDQLVGKAKKIAENTTQTINKTDDGF